MDKNNNLETVELILHEASAYNLRNEVVEMAENLRTILKTAGVLEDFSDVRIYEEALKTCITTPEELWAQISNL
jgi:hypothetical protein